MLMMKSWQITLVVGLLMITIELKPAEAWRRVFHGRAGSVARQSRQRYSPYQAGPSGAAPYQAGPSGAAPYQAGPSGAAPYQAGPSGAAPYQAGPSGAAPYQAGPSGAAPYQAGPSGAAPYQAGQAATPEPSHENPLRLLTSGVYQCMTGVNLKRLGRNEVLPEITHDLLNRLKALFPGNALLNSIMPPKKLMDLYYYMDIRNNLEAGISICAPHNRGWSKNDLLQLCVDQTFTDRVAHALGINERLIYTQDVINCLLNILRDANIALR